MDWVLAPILLSVEFVVIRMRNACTHEPHSVDSHLCLFLVSKENNRITDTQERMQSFAVCPLVRCQVPFFFLFGMILFIYLWLCWVFTAQQTFSSCSQQGLFFIEVHGLLIAAASLVAQCRLQAHRPTPPLMCRTPLLAWEHSSSQEATISDPLDLLSLFHNI